MKVFSLNQEQWIPQPIEKVFSFFNRPENLETITPASLHFQILTPKPVQMQQGTLIDYAIEILGVPQRWTSLISLYQPPYRFEDVQIRGPYDFWHHTHEFKTQEQGTLMTDQVLYALPWGPFGRIAHGLFVRSQLEMIFKHRSEVVRQFFENSHE